jgi:NTE family protein
MKNGLPSPKLVLFLFFLIYSLLNISMSHAQIESDSIWITLEKEKHQNLPLENLNYYPLKKMKVALVLSGGGARGLAHIGVLDAFEQNSITVDLIVGTSIGSIVGGFYAAGFSAEEIQQIFEEVDWNSIFADENYRSQLLLSQKDIPRHHILQFRLDGLVPIIPSSISQGQKVFQVLYNRLLLANFQAANDFDNLKIPFKAVATDLINGKKVVLDTGDLAEAINASTAFPLLFAPVEINGMWLVDGGITDNLPVEVALQEDADFIIAVDATSNLRSRDEMGLPWEVADQVTTIMMQNQTAESRQKADFVIKPNLEVYKGGDFAKTDSIIQVGYDTAIVTIDSLKRLIQRAELIHQDENIYLGRVATVEFEGLSQRVLQKLEDSLHVKQGMQLFREQVSRDLRLMYQSGYLEDVQALIKGEYEGCQVTFFAKEQPRINQVNIKYQGVLPDSMLSEISTEFANEPLNIIQLSSHITELKNLYIQRGYSLAQLSSVSYQPSSNDLEISIDEGAIAEIRITGNKVTKDLVILREFPLKEGDLFQAPKAIEGIQNIYSTNLFDRVLINLVKEGQKNTLLIKVKEKKYFIARLGAHYSLERKTEAFVEFLSDNFLGTAGKVSLFGSVGDFSRHAEALFYTVRLFRTYLTTRISGYYDDRKDRYYQNFEWVGNYQIIRRGGRFSIGHQIERLGVISLVLRLENVDVYSGDVDFPFKDDYRLRTFSISSVVDKRDKLPFPEKGIYNRWYWEAGSRRLLESTTPFTKIFLGLEGYYPFLKRFNYHPYIYLGSADRTLPFPEFFYFGGQDNFPGLYEKEKLGRQFIQTGIDMRYKLGLKFPVDAYIICNYSMGASWERPDAKIEGKDFLHSISATFAINSLLGPIRLTYTHVLEKREIIQFSFGYNF